MSNVNIDDHLAANPRAAAYVWEAYTEDGVTVAVECPPGMPDTSFSAMGFRFRARTGKNIDDVHTFVNMTERTVVVHCKPLRDGLAYTLPIAPGVALVWCHRVVQAFQIMGHVQVEAFETMVFGRETPAADGAIGKIEIMQIWPDGEYKGFESYADAMNAL